MDDLWAFFESGAVFEYLDMSSAEKLPRSTTRLGLVAHSVQVRSLRKKVKFDKKLLKAMELQNPRVLQALRTLRLGLHQSYPTKGGHDVAAFEKFSSARENSLGNRLKDLKVEANGTIDLNTHGIYAFVKEAEEIDPAPAEAAAAAYEDDADFVIVAKEDLAQTTPRIS